MWTVGQIETAVAGHSLIRDMDRLPAGVMRIETSFQYPDGASVEVFLGHEPSLLPEERAPYTLDDAGQTMAWLLDVQVKPWLSSRRRAFVDDALRVYGIRQEGAVLGCRLSALSELPDGIVRLGQACLRVADLTYTRRAALQTEFTEEIGEVLTDIEVPYDQDVELLGRYGNVVRVDFVAHGASTTSAVLALSSANRSQAHVLANEVFRRWYDLDVPERSEQRVTVWDDRHDVYRDDDLQRLHEISSLVPLSDRQAVADLLVA